MGGSSSKPATPPPPPPTPPKLLTDRPWREPSIWNSQLEKQLIQKIRDIEPKDKPNLLTTGPVGAGKSALINAILSIGKETRVSKAQSGSSASSFTVEYAGYKHTLLQNFILRDTMGVEPNDGVGFHVDDFMYLIQGHIKNKYKFNPASPISTGHTDFIKNPTSANIIHCVIFVISAVDVDAGIPEAYVRKIGQLQDRLRREQIPRVLILTNADRLCVKVNVDITNMFWSVKVQRAVKIASEVFSIDKASIHPVVNYEDNATVTTTQNIPLLLALRQSMSYANDRVEQLLDEADIQ